MISLYDYQQDAIESVREHYRNGVRSVLLVSPTGSGKTVMFGAMTQSAVSRGKRVWILAHRSELLDQIGATLDQFDVGHGEISSKGKPTNHQVQVASVFSLRNRLHILDAPDVIIVDEAHHCLTGNSWGQVLQSFADARVLGVTATPERLSGEGLGAMFQTMVQGPTTRELIARGRLSKYDLYRPPSTLDLKGVRKQAGDYAKSQLDERVERSSLVGDAVEHYRRLANGKRGIAFCVSLRHAAAVADYFNQAGIPAACIDGTLTMLERRRIVTDLSRGDLRMMTSCDLVSEGFDCPAIEVGLLLRPTASLGLYLQQVGRTLRTMPGKTSAIILDHAGNSTKHGLPDDEREWSLDGQAAKKQRAENVTPITTCKSCFAVFPVGPKACPYCGTIAVLKQRQVESKAGELEKVDPALVALAQKQHRREQGSARSLDDLIAVGRKRGYSNPAAWAWHVYQSRRKA